MIDEESKGKFDGEFKILDEEAYKTNRMNHRRLNLEKMMNHYNLKPMNYPFSQDYIIGGKNPIGNLWIYKGQYDSHNRPHGWIVAIFSDGEILYEYRTYDAK